MISKRETEETMVIRRFWWIYIRKLYIYICEISNKGHCQILIVEIFDRNRKHQWSRMLMIVSPCWSDTATIGNHLYKTIVLDLVWDWLWIVQIAWLQLLFPVFIGGVHMFSCPRITSCLVSAALSPFKSWKTSISWRLVGEQRKLPYGLPRKTCRISFQS